MSFNFIRVYNNIMPRIQNCLCKDIKFEPNVVYFKPQGVRMQNLESIDLSMEELESLRLRYVDDLWQTEGAEKMKISQSNYQRILNSCCKKIAGALTEGKAIKIVKHI